MRKWISLLYSSRERDVNSMVKVFSQWVGLRSPSNRELLLSNFYDVLLRRHKASSGATKKHIEEIRKKSSPLGSGVEPNPLTKDIHHAVHNLSLELYNKRYLLAHAALGRSLYCSLPLSKLNIAF